MRQKIFPTQPLSGSNIGNYWNLLVENDFKVDVKYIPRMLYTSFASLFLTSPLGKIESLFKQKEINQTDIAKEPIFIIGHWRSGTTFLHYLMSKDEHLGYFSNAQSLCPGIMFIPAYKQFIQLHLPSKRPMDDVDIELDLPQEEEFALGNTSTQSCYHWWVFPQKMKSYFDKYVLFQNLTKSEQGKFKCTYTQLIKKISLANAGKRLLIKNPANTGRIPFLLELFPNAKFIYLHRNPVDVYHSTIKLHSRLIEHFTFQKIDKKTIEQNTLYFYQTLMEKYQKDKTLIPSKNLLEISYQDLIQNPLSTVQNIYDSLDIPHFQQAQPVFQAFIKAQQTYQAEVYKPNYEKENELKQIFASMNI